MSEKLSGTELAALVARVFQPRPEDRALAVLVDLPDRDLPDTPAWRERRQMAAAWVEELAALSSRTGIEVRLVLYRNVRANNADLPGSGHLHAGGALPVSADALDPRDAVPFEEILGRHRLVIAPTQLSATAPLKLAAPRLGFRAATMPGFSPAMIPALRLDYGLINRRVQALKRLLDEAESATARFLVDGHEEHTLTLDLRFRTAHASGGLLPDPGSAGNLPSGEAYVVPYEGEREGDPSRTRGTLPVQFGEEVVVYAVEENRARSVTGPGPAAREEAARLATEPAYGNLAELGLGVLADLGVEPSGEVLLDEKLGLHIAFGRSDHFGGQVGPKRFSRPEAVVHIDRVYVPALQARIRVRGLDLAFPAAPALALIRDDRYVVDLDGR